MMNSFITQEPDHSKQSLELAAGVEAGFGGLTALAGSALVGLAVKSSGSHTGISVYSLKIWLCYTKPTSENVHIYIVYIVSFDCLILTFNDSMWVCRVLQSDHHGISNRGIKLIRRSASDGDQCLVSRFPKKLLDVYLYAIFIGDSF